MITSEQIALESNTIHQIEQLEAAIITTKALRHTLDNLTGSNEAGNSLSKPLELLRSKLATLREDRTRRAYYSTDEPHFRYIKE